MTANEAHVFHSVAPNETGILIMFALLYISPLLPHSCTFQSVLLSALLRYRCVGMASERELTSEFVEMDDLTTAEGGPAPILVGFQKVRSPRSFTTVSICALCACVCVCECACGCEGGADV